MKNFEEIREEIKAYPNNFFSYRELGDYYWEKKHNVNQAYLCYEQAYALCDETESKINIQQLLQDCRQDEHFSVKPASFVILSYNFKEMMIDCLQSIRNSCAPGTYEIVIVDNDSKDGIRDYLMEQKDIVLQLNEHNTSFAEGCNQGVRLAKPDNDILLLNNDTIVPPFALFYMRLALYEAEDIAAVGPTSNAVLISQLAPGGFSTKEQWIENAKSVHIPSLHALENKAWLVGFALLIKRKAWDLTGNLDERFVRGLYEDTDYGFRLNANGYRSVLCHNAFIFHYGSVSMKKDPVAYNQSLKNNEERLNQKLGLQFNRFMACHTELVDMMKPPVDGKMSVLEVGCGFGLTLSKIEYRYPDAYAVGIETNKTASEIAHRIANVICADIEKDALPFEKESFDYILCSNAINYFENTKKAMEILKKYLKSSGKILVLQPNIMNASNFIEILSGRFETVEGMDRDVKHLYTKNETIQLLSDAGLKPYSLLNMVSEYMAGHPREKALLESIGAMQGVTIGEDFRVQSYIITCNQK